MRVADIVRRFFHFLLWRGYFEPKKITSNCNALAKSTISYPWVSFFTLFFLDVVKQCSLQKQTNAVTSSERAHSITWYKQKRRRNRWASKQAIVITLQTYRYIILLLIDFCHSNIPSFLDKLPNGYIGILIRYIFIDIHVTKICTDLNLSESSFFNL